ncbi:MFS transporter [Mangrovicoccus algicola]|uniref:MFS transporter n=1 Tax=Mangrovicoccus algicola TaxID=2771008 RepID=A0A8J6YWK1_9RHOB|nr:MFS transporter [Mangrovicoccus algicola]MBE3640503.1 MFS transporter [Mangrovicoccus algicola]
MFRAFVMSWPLFLGIFLLMVGNGSQGTLLGIRGGMEGFSTFELSLVMSAYFAGFLGGSQLAPEMIRRVGHIRVFAALASFISAILILYPTITDPWVWIALRVVFGFCMCGVYVTAESWLNSSTPNNLRGQTLSLYMIVQTSGIVLAQGLSMLGDPAQYVLFVVVSVLVSISFAPILLSVTPTPTFGSTKRMGIGRLFKVSPLGCIGILLMGGVYSATFGMASVFGTRAGLSVSQISLFIAAIYLGGLVCQFPIGWLSDRMDRRQLILAAAAAGALGAAVPLLSLSFPVVLLAGAVIGGVSNPLYGLLVAHTADFLEPDDMASASGQLLFLNGFAAVIGPVVTGFAMGSVGPNGFFLFLLGLFAILTIYAGYRMTQRPAPDASETGEFAPVLPTASLVTMEAAAESYMDQEETAADDDEEEDHAA